MKRIFAFLVAVAAAVTLLGPLSARDASALPALGIELQPIQVCNDGGADCANAAMQLFEAVTDKIWAQADIDVQWRSWITVNDSDKLNETDFGDLTASGTDVVNVWFVESLSECGGPANPATLFGCGGGGRMAVTDLVFSFNGGIGRLDTIAHELGHVLGLGHDDYGAGGADNLMTSGGSRTIPSDIGDINPDGAGLSKLTAEQIAQARTSSRLFAIPEPGMALILGAGVVLLAMRRRV